MFTRYKKEIVCGSRTLINQSEQVLYQFVLNTIADDYESFEIVWEHVVKWAAERGLTLGRDSVVETLERAIREGDAQSYLRSPQPPPLAVCRFFTGPH